jgi:hypothetical protein
MTLTASYSFAAGAPSENGKEIKAIFRHDFENAQLISTEVHEGFTKVQFRMNEQMMTAFYSNSGDLIAVTRNILSSQLPVTLLMNFKKHYDGYWITDLFEMSQDAASTYYMTLENSDSKITLRSNGDSWEIYSDFRK